MVDDARIGEAKQTRPTTENNVKTPQYFDASNAVNPATRQLSVATRIIEVATRNAAGVRDGARART